MFYDLQRLSLAGWHPRGIPLSILRGNAEAANAPPSADGAMVAGGSAGRDATRRDGQTPRSPTPNTCAGMPKSPSQRLVGN
jgi:hypothetical protein